MEEERGVVEIFEMGVSDGSRLIGEIELKFIGDEFRYYGLQRLPIRSPS